MGRPPDILVKGAGSGRMELVTSKMGESKEIRVLLHIPELTVCFIWHMHQPDYKDQLSGRYMMPWVRLHAIKDYLDMVTVLSEFPKIRQTFNLVPSLIEQLKDYSQPGVWDRHQEVTLREVYTPEDRLFILERFFDAHPDRMIGALPTYRKLHERRNQFKTAAEGVSAFSDQEFSDITALFNLCWFDPQWMAKYPELSAMAARGKNFTLAERARILEIQRELIAQTLPTYQQFQDAGQIEITTTPFYHPILPLLLDSQTAKIGRPGTFLPKERFHHEEDARAHLERAIAQYEECFGRKPQGIWPSEQSISPETLKLFHEYGFQWTVSNEGNLARSLGIHWDKDEYGHYRNIQELSCPYEFAGVKMLFRNLTLSDLIGFSYAGVDSEVAAHDCYRRLKQIQLQMASHPEVARPVVTIALDGENCWESYAQDGVPFLKALYQHLSNDDTLNISRVQDYLADTAEHSVKKLPYLHAGSWIDSDFHIWIGDPIKNTAWDLLQKTRRELASACEANLLTTEVRQKAWEEIYIAEGSDWFWWYGEPHNSGQDHLFDYQFRLHLKNVYKLLGKKVPDEFNTPLSPMNGRKVAVPEKIIRPTVDGLLTSLDEWDGAGRLDLSCGEGAMHRGDRLVTCVHYGYDEEWVYLRFDIQHDLLKPSNRIAVYVCNAGKTRHNSPIRLKARQSLMVLTQTYLYAYEFQVADLQSPACRVQAAEAIHDYLWVDRAEMPVTVVMQDLLEMAIPFSSLNTEPGEAVELAVVVVDHEVVIDFVPQDSLLSLRRPSPSVVIAHPEKKAQKSASIP